MSKTESGTEVIEEDELSVDPLDAFMASIDSEIMQQAALAAASAKPPSSTGIIVPIPAALPRPFDTQPAPAQLAAAKKVANSPFIVALQRRKGKKIGNGDHQGSREAGVGMTDASDSFVRLLQSHPSEFLRSYGHILSPADLDDLVPSLDPEVVLHVRRLQALMSRQRDMMNDSSHDHFCTGALAESKLATAATVLGESGGPYRERRGERHSRPPGGARIRNRRYKRLHQLAEGGVWFSDEAMKERDPWLWHEFVGRQAGEEKPAPRDAVDRIPGSTSMGTYLKESLTFLSQPQVGNWPSETSVRATTRERGSSLSLTFFSRLATGPIRVEQGEQLPEDTRPPEGSALTADEEAMDDEAEEKLEPGDIPDSSQVTPSAGARSLPGDASSGGDTGVTAAFRVRDNAEAGTRGTGRDARSDVVDDDRRITFADGIGGGGRDQNAPDTVGMQVEAEERDSEEEAGDGETGREAVVRILWERFLDGEEEGVNYADVDGDERLDDLDQIARDKEDRWFGGQEDDPTD